MRRLYIVHTGLGELRKMNEPCPQCGTKAFVQTYEFEHNKFLVDCKCGERIEEFSYPKLANETTLVLRHLNPIRMVE